MRLPITPPAHEGKDKGQKESEQAPIPSRSRKYPRTPLFVFLHLPTKIFVELVRILWGEFIKERPGHMRKRFVNRLDVVCDINRAIVFVGLPAFVTGERILFAHTDFLCF